MEVKNLHFFDRDGYDMNLTWDSVYRCWVGNVYFPKVSVGLYANTDIYIMEETDDGFFFPSGVENDKITFEWDILNKFVDEFFMFTFDDTYVMKDLSALTYVPQDGPDVEVINLGKFEQYEVFLPTEEINKVLPVHIAFSAAPQSDATTYKRTLVMKFNGHLIARITFYAETVDEDERLKIWNSNLGYNITPEDALIFKKSDINEPLPNYILLNEKRKELMMEGHNIYPFVGSYMAIINAIKFFGYENLNIVEYWKNVNENDPNYLKEFQSSKYSLKNVETLSIGGSKIPLPNKNFKKTGKISLVYSINSPIDGEYDEMELPLVKEYFAYTIEEAIIKLFALRKKLNKEFMPAGKKIFEIIGEGNYFGLNCLVNGVSYSSMEQKRPYIPIGYKVYPSNTVYITNDYDFNEFVFDSISEGSDSINYRPVSDINMEPVEFNRNLKHIEDMLVSELGGDDVSVEELCGVMNDSMMVPNYDLAVLYKNFYEYYEGFHRNNGTDAPCDGSEYGESDIDLRASAKVVISLDDFEEVLLDDMDIRFDDIDNVSIDDISSRYDMIEWTISFSDDQTDEDDANVGINTVYPDRDFKPISIRGDINKTNRVYFRLPYLGYYDVTIRLWNTKNGDTTQRVIEKDIKVEPYKIDIRGFYYDARELPDSIDYNAPDELIKFAYKHLKCMSAWAIQEHLVKKDTDATMVNYTMLGDISHPGPYKVTSMSEYWYLFDHLNEDITMLIPSFEYARYIRSGVDVKPYTWFLLGYDNTKITGKANPKWTIRREDDKGLSAVHEGAYLTYLLREEGNYIVTLELTDINGNVYNIERNIIVVTNEANYKLYNAFRKDFLVEDDLYETWGGRIDRPGGIKTALLKNVVGNSPSSTTNSSSSNNQIYLNSVNISDEDSALVTSFIKIVGAGATTVSADSNGNITIYSPEVYDDIFDATGYTSRTSVERNSIASSEGIKFNHIVSDEVDKSHIIKSDYETNNEWLNSGMVSTNSDEDIIIKLYQPSIFSLVTCDGYHQYFAYGISTSAGSGLLSRHKFIGAGGINIYGRNGNDIIYIDHMCDIVIEGTHNTSVNSVTSIPGNGIYLKHTENGEVTSSHKIIGDNGTTVTYDDSDNIIITGNHYISKNVVAATPDSKSDGESTNGVYLNHIENGEVTSSHKISGDNGVVVSSDMDGNITIIGSMETDDEPIISKNVVAATPGYTDNQESTDGVYLNYLNGQIIKSSHNIKGNENTIVSSDENGNIKIETKISYRDSDETLIIS